MQATSLFEEYEERSKKKQGSNGEPDHVGLC